MVPTARGPRRIRGILAVLGLTLLIFPLPAAPDDPPADPAAPRECTCDAAQGCHEYLRRPTIGTDPTCACGACKTSKNCCAEKAPVACVGCKNSASLGCFFKRHCISWGFDCSACAHTKCCAKNCEKCPACAPEEAKDALPAPEWDIKAMDEEVEKERKIFGVKTPVVVINSRHFHFVTDIPGILLNIPGKGQRQIDEHEFAHVYMERAERAYNDFSELIGPDLRLQGKRIGIYLARTEQASQRASVNYLGNQRSNLLYGIPSSFTGALQKYGDDNSFHHYVRHQLGHCLISAYGGYSDKTCMPKWVFEGAAHFLGKWHPLFKDKAVFCANESTAQTGSPSDWDKQTQKLVETGKATPFSQLMLMDSDANLTYFQHVQVWSLFAFLLDCRPTEFAVLLRDIKAKRDQRECFQKHLNWTPEQFDQAWKNYWAAGGKRPGGETVGVDADPIAAIAREKNVFVRASLVKSLAAPKEVRIAQALVNACADPSELVRTVAVSNLSKTEEPKIREWLRKDGLGKSIPLGRAGAALALGLMNDTAAGDALRLALKDSFWLVRANAAAAIAMLGTESAAGDLIPVAGDPVQKVRIAACDALKRLGPAAAGAVQTVVDAPLKDSAWQVRSAAVEALGAMGGVAGIGPMIARMPTETGRLQEDMGFALEKLTGFRYGAKPAQWKEWWDRVGASFKGPGPQPKDPPKDEPVGTHAKGTYYGIKVVSNSVMFVLDTSLSMLDRVEVETKAGAGGGKVYKGDTKIAVAKQELEEVVTALPPETRFNMIFFNSKATKWKSDRAKATEEVRRGAVGAVESSQPVGETNYYDAFNLVFEDPADPSDPRLSETPDTAYFLTDGSPTKGDITDPELLQSWFREHNRFARIRIHVIAMGRTDVNVNLLKGIAQIGNGKFVHIGSAGPK